MKCKTFNGNIGEVEVAFNNWAKGKALTKDIIIHSNVRHIFDREIIPKLSIIIYYPEGSSWDKEPEQPKISTIRLDAHFYKIEAEGVPQ